jgi:hypothetical protein
MRFVEKEMTSMISRKGESRSQQEIMEGKVIFSHEKEGRVETTKQS